MRIKLNSPAAGGSVEVAIVVVSDLDPARRRPTEVEIAEAIQRGMKGGVVGLRVLQPGVTEMTLDDYAKRAEGGADR